MCVMHNIDTAATLSATDLSRVQCSLINSAGVQWGSHCFASVLGGVSNVLGNLVRPHTDIRYCACTYRHQVSCMHMETSGSVHACADTRYHACTTDIRYCACVYRQHILCMHMQAAGTVHACMDTRFCTCWHKHLEWDACVETLL